MSKSATVYTLMAALLKAEDILGKDRKWQDKNPSQEKLVSRFLPFMPEARTIKEIESISGRSAKQINDFLAKHDFSIMLKDFAPNEFGVAAVLDLLVKWLAAGKKVQIKGADKKQYPGVYLKEGVRILNAYGNHNGPIARIRTKSDDEVFMTMIDKVPDGLDLIEFASKLISQFHYNDDHEGLHFPMIDFKNQPDISWLLGLATTDSTGRHAWISQAKQETKLRMNEIGARVQDAVALGVMRGISRPKTPLIINRPFLCIFTRPGLKMPLAVFHLEPDCWKDPGGLD
ncbi:MAG: hypothetical protein A2Y82_04155 [Candidatus Buchananbacteria bacterium RBG_13_36_9]|uniref:Uncharacterized protein n=1 Tax=Candidatus Buchananbacteria bacterium RBG_13_36_9 TaxID=1797530 RepID=A0A1G1XT89_9BACT|nr:MAG: hypothetical protein A2Y82_04155 [Candidatus Buchananbacteria bacterium RBG_13_36_9]